MMKLFLLTLFLFSNTAFAQKIPEGKIYEATILRVIDGDTVVIAAPFLPAPLKPELAVRIYGVDTPEKAPRAKCLKENKQGWIATEFTKEAIAQSRYHRVIIYSWDKYGGRILGDILLNGRSLRSLLIQNGHAREYYGEAKQSWCD